MGRHVPEPLARGLLLAAVALYVTVAVRTAWVSDDAYFTFRTIEQWMAGNGPVWNAGQRVQAYTHPAWMLLLSAAAFLTRELWLTSIVVSLVLSSAAVVIFAFVLARDARWAIVGVLALTFSRAFVDYSTSGLENPLSYLLVAVFAAVWFRMRDSRTRLALLSLTGTTLLLSRPDYLLLVAPALAYRLHRSPFSLGDGLRALALGASPLLLWEAFSLLYYGFPIPNTGYAKLGTGIPRLLLVEQGVHYFTHSLVRDPVTPLALAAGLLAALRVRRPRGEGVLVVGVLLYLAYVLWIGGDFMAGRFLAVPLFTAIILMGRLEGGGRRPLAAGVVVVLLGFASPHPTVLSGAYYGMERDDVIDEHGIGDERAFYYEGTGLLRLGVSGEMPAGEVTVGPSRSVPLSELHTLADPSDVLVVASGGLFGYYVGTGPHLVDVFGLGDPLLARLEAEPRPNWRIGHPWRRVPEGYVASLETGTNRIPHPGLRVFYDHLRTVVEGDLLAPGRLGTIVRFNVGAFEHHLDAYADDQYLAVTLADFEEPGPGVPTDAAGRVEMPATGIEIRLEERRRDGEVRLAVEGGGNFAVLFFRGGEEVGRSGVELARAEPRIHPVEVRVPWPARLLGYDAIRVRPVLTAERFSILEPELGG